MFQILWIVIGGAIVGLLARALMRRGGVPLWATVCLGVLGALIGNVIAGAIGVRYTRGFDWIRHVLQIGVACALVGAAAPFFLRRGGGGRGGTGGGGSSLYGGSGRQYGSMRDRERDRSRDLR